jgi:DNA-binding IclR family transcriptional regulator
MSSYVIPNLANACKVLELVARSVHGLSLSELEQQLSLPRTTAFRILQTLCIEGLLCKQGRKYLVGNSLFRLGLDLINHHPLQQQALPQLQQLVLQTGLTAQLVLPQQHKAMIAAVVDSSTPAGQSPNLQQIAARPGFCAALNCSAAGKLFLAHLYFDELEQLAVGFEQQTSQSITDLARLRVELPRIQARGYALDEQECRDGVRCLAAPVRDQRGVVVAAVGVTGAVAVFPQLATATVAAAVKQAAIQISLATYRPELLANSR